MNLSKPIHIVLLGSGAIGVLLWVLLFFGSTFGWIEIGSYGLVLIPIIGAAVTFIIFSILVGNFINNKIRFIYKIITNRQVVEDKEYSLSEDVLSRLTKETVQWASVQKQQITQLQKQAAFRKEFLGNLAHELKTPVFSIQGYILTLLEGGLEDERVNRDFLVRALNGVDRISNLLEDLDEIAKFETDRFNLKVTKFSIVELARSVIKELESKAKEKNITLKFDRHYEPIMVAADKKRITQVLVNLVSNSISYGLENGETVISFEHTEKKQLLIEVADNGVGLSEEHLPRLFERFYRVDKSRERNIGGSGLGLAIVKHIIEAHKQTINVKSTEGIGSTFSFTLEKA